jgi:plastocyanin
MHTAALHLAPVLAAEKSRSAFYILGVVLVAWAMIVSVGVGMNRPSFPGDLRGQRAVIAITVILVLATITSAVATSSSPAKAGENTSAKAPAPAETQTAPATPAATATATTPATTGATTTPAKATTTPAKASPPAQSALKLAADPTGLLKFDATQLSAKSGTVTIAFTNSSPAEHNLTIAQGSKVLGATPTFLSGAKTLTLALKPGTYTFYCSVPGHRQAGMQGTLKVS